MVVKHFTWQFLLPYPGRSQAARIWRENAALTKNNGKDYNSSLPFTNIRHVQTLWGAFGVSSDSALPFFLSSLRQTGALGHADSLSPFFCRRGNCHPLSFSPLNTMWRMYACVCTRVLGRR